MEDKSPIICPRSRISALWIRPKLGCRAKSQFAGIQSSANARSAGRHRHHCPRIPNTNAGFGSGFNIAVDVYFSHSIVFEPTPTKIDLSMCGVPLWLFKPMFKRRMETKKLKLRLFSKVVVAKNQWIEEKTNLESFAKGFALKVHGEVNKTKSTQSSATPGKVVLDSSAKRKRAHFANDVTLFT